VQLLKSQLLPLQHPPLDNLNLLLSKFLPSSECYRGEEQQEISSEIGRELNFLNDTLLDPEVRTTPVSRKRFCHEWCIYAS
jgi:hypothetical protein